MRSYFAVFYMRPFPTIDIQFAETFFRQSLETILAKEQKVSGKVLAAIATYRNPASAARDRDLACARDLHDHLQKFRLELEAILANREGLPLAYKKDCTAAVAGIFNSIRKEYTAAGKNDFLPLVKAHSTRTLVHALLWFPYTPAIDDGENLPMREHILDQVYTMYVFAQSSAHTSLPRGSVQALVKGIALVYQLLDADITYLKQKNLIMPNASSLAIKLALGKRHYQLWSLAESKNLDITRA